MRHSKMILIVAAGLLITSSAFAQQRRARTNNAPTQFRRSTAAANHTQTVAHDRFSVPVTIRVSSHSTTAAENVAKSEAKKFAKKVEKKLRDTNTQGTVAIGDVNSDSWRQNEANIQVTVNYTKNRGMSQGWLRDAAKRLDNGTGRVGYRKAQVSAAQRKKATLDAIKTAALTAQEFAKFQADVLGLETGIPTDISSTVYTYGGYWGGTPETHANVKVSSEILGKKRRSGGGSN